MKRVLAKMLNTKVGKIWVAIQILKKLPDREDNKKSFEEFYSTNNRLISFYNNVNKVNKAIF